MTLQNYNIQDTYARRSEILSELHSTGAVIFDGIDDAVDRFMQESKALMDSGDILGKPGLPNHSIDSVKRNPIFKRRETLKFDVEKTQFPQHPLLRQARALRDSYHIALAPLLARPDEFYASFLFHKYPPVRSKYLVKSHPDETPTLTFPAVGEPLSIRTLSQDWYTPELQQGQALFFLENVEHEVLNQHRGEPRYALVIDLHTIIASPANHD